jgi:hypothetical protein
MLQNHLNKFLFLHKFKNWLHNLFKPFHNLFTSWTVWSITNKTCSSSVSILSGSPLLVFDVNGNTIFRIKERSSVFLVLHFQRGSRHLMIVIKEERIWREAKHNKCSTSHIYSLSIDVGNKKKEAMKIPPRFFLWKLHRNKTRQCFISWDRYHPSYW